MKTDAQLQRDVIDELRWEPSVTEKEIGVAVRDGVITLSGSVPTFAEKYAAEQAVERVSGVRAIADELEVRLPSLYRRGDTDIAHTVVNALTWDVSVPDERITSRVADGWVTIEGEVEWRFQKDAATHAVRNLAGVRGVSNMIRVAPRVSPYEVSEHIKDALRRNAELDASRIAVDASGGRVTLRGSVRSWSERTDVERAAWSAPGVTDVVDQMSIQP